MHIGIKIPNWGPFAGPRSVAACAVVAEERGFDSVWVSDHVAMPPNADASSHGLDPRTPFLDPFTTLSYVAAHTERVQLGTGVYVLPLRHPLITAKQASSVDVLSDGRLLLGIGVGWLRDEFELLDAPFEERGGWTDAAVAAIRGAWSDADPDVEMWPKPVRSIPVLIGGHSPAALARAVRIGDGWYGSGLSAPDFAEIANELDKRMREVGDPGRLMVGTRAADVNPDHCVSTVDAFAQGGADFLVLDAVVSDSRSAVEWVHRTADALKLESGSAGEPLQIAL